MLHKKHVELLNLPCSILLSVHLSLFCGVYDVSCPQRLKVSVIERKETVCQLFSVAVMRYVAAYLLAVLGGNSNPGKEEITRILESIGLDVDDERLSKVAPRSLSTCLLSCCPPPPQVMSELEGKDINVVIEEGMGKLASMPSGE